MRFVVYGTGAVGGVTAALLETAVARVGARPGSMTLDELEAALRS